MLSVTTALGLLLALRRRQHWPVAVGLAVLLAVSYAGPIWGAASYLAFPVVDLLLAVLLLHRAGAAASAGVAIAWWAGLAATYAAWSPALAHGVAAAATLAGLCRRRAEIEPEEVTAATLGLSDLAALYPLARSPEIWAETARPQSLAVWTILAALETYWLWRRWPPSWSWRSASGWAGRSSASARRWAAALARVAEKIAAEKASRGASHSASGSTAWSAGRPTTASASAE